MVRATWNDAVLAEGDDTVVVEGNHSFLHRSLRDARRTGRIGLVRRVALFAFLPIAAAFTGACSDSDESATAAKTAEGDGDAAVEVLPFELVQASDMVFESDPADPTRGIFRVETTEPMICAIVWGTDENFGRFNNSLAMDGTGIVDHDVFLPDVEPGREYRFVVQGTTADGTLYRSEVGTFSFDPDVAAPGTSLPAGDNLALGATIADASSEFSDSFATEQAIDGDPSTEWATSGDGDDGFVVVDLGDDRRIGEVEYLTRTMADGSATTLTYTVTVDDGEPLGPFPASTAARPAVHPLDVTGRRVRFDVESSTGGNVGASEIRLYGS